MQRVVGGIFLGLALGALGCNGSAGEVGNDGSSKAARTFRIAVIPKGTSHDFWYSVRAGAEAADHDLAEVEITWKGPLGEGDTAEQIKMVESFIANGYDGICLAPLDAVALRKPVDQALAAGIPVLIFDSGLADQSGIVSYVATNNQRGGQRAGEYMAELLGGKGRVILMRYDLNSQSTEQREAGFLEALAKFPDIKLISQDKYGGPDESKAVALSENLLATYGDQVDGIFCPNQSTASGMLTVLRRDPRGLAGKVKFIGFDAGENLADGLKTGHMHATVLQDPVKMGYDSVKVMYEKLSGQQVPERVETEEALATSQNYDQPEIKRLLFPETVK
ncbi:MAG: substrate-binding domain-containing protein [Pirellulales bacterium]|nr:substrate-binding domain-containing protein [Pirellulales bacterium]